MNKENSNKRFRLSARFSISLVLLVVSVAAVGCRQTAEPAWDFSEYRESLRPLLESEPIAREVTAALKTAEERRDWRPLTDLLSADRERAWRVACAMASLPDGQGVAPLLAAIEKPDAEHRRELTYGLVFSGDARAVRFLIDRLAEAATHSDAIVAHGALRAMTGETFQPVPAVWRRWWRGAKSDFENGGSLSTEKLESNLIAEWSREKDLEMIDAVKGVMDDLRRENSDPGAEPVLAGMIDEFARLKEEARSRKRSPESEAGIRA